MTTGSKPNLSDEAGRDINSVRVVAGDRTRPVRPAGARPPKAWQSDRGKSAHDMRARQKFRRR